MSSVLLNIDHWRPENEPETVDLVSSSNPKGDESADPRDLGV